MASVSRDRDGSYVVYTAAQDRCTETVTGKVIVCGFDPQYEDCKYLK